MWHRRLFLSACAGIALAVAILGSFNNAAAQTVLRRGHGASPESLDPQKNFGVRDALIIDDLFEGLTAIGPKGDVLPGAAESWDVSPDGKTYRFHLRPNLKWSNGDPLVAQDFVDGMLRLLAPETASDKAYYFFSVISIVNAAGYNDGSITDPGQVGIQAPDPRTVVITLDHPAPHVPYLLVSFEAAPVHKASLAKHGNEFTRPGNLVSNGAYVLSEFVPLSHVTLRKNPYYWDAVNVQIDEVIYYVTDDEQAEIKRYLAGELDITNTVPANQIEKLQQSHPEELRLAPGPTTYFVSFNIRKPPFDNAKLRQALSYAIDREILQEKIVKGGYQASYSFVPQGLDPSYQGPRLEIAGMDKAAREALAKKLYQEAGFGPDNPLEVEILSTTNEEETRKGQGIGTMWTAVLGVKVKHRNQEFNAWLQSFNDGDWQVANDSVAVDFPGAEGFISYLAPVSDTGYSWKSPEYDTLYEKAKQAADPAERNKFLADAEKILLDTHIVVPLSGDRVRVMVKPYVEGWHDNVVGYHASKYMRIRK